MGKIIDFPLSADFKQKNTVDCGAACVRMLYAWAEGDFVRRVFNFSDRPLWTIEIVEYLIAYNKFDIVYVTTYDGVDESHLSLDWYKECSHNELCHIKNLFLKAKMEKWGLIKAKLLLADILNYLDNNSVVLILLNSAVLHAVQSNFPVFTSILRYFYLNDTNNVFSGHFVLIIGYNDEKNEFYCMDPAYSGVQMYSYDIIEEARGHSGTDNDVVIVSKL